MKPEFLSKTTKTTALAFMLGVTTLSAQTGKGLLNRGDKLTGRAVLPAATFASGPTSGKYIGEGPINGQEVPFINKQPVQGVSALIHNGDGTYMALSDNGFGGIENSADYHLRIYHIRPELKPRTKGTGEIEVLGFIELSDPDHKIPFSITNHFSTERILTGADFDPESLQRAKDGTYWIGDEFGPFLLHFDSAGRLLDAPIALPDFDNPGQELRAPQNPYNEEISALRVMNAVRAHAQKNGNSRTPVFSPWFVLLADNDPATYDASRQTPPAGLAPASSEIFNIRQMQSAGFPVVAWTVNDSEQMTRLMHLGVDGIISDRPDLLLEAVKNFDGNNDGQPDFMTPDGLIDISKLDAQGHRGARDLRPENTLPAMEAALDYLMTTLETDFGVTKDGLTVLNHDPHIESAKVRRADGSAYTYSDEVLVKDLTLAEIQSTYIADKLLSGRPAQSNDLALSPVSAAFAAEEGIHPYAMPSLNQLFEFVNYYVTYYQSGPGSTHPEASKRWKNASQVRFNIETKINPRTDTDERGDVFAERTLSPEAFAQAVLKEIKKYGMEQRADVQSFDFRTLILVQEQNPAIRTAYLFGDFPKTGNSSDGTNLQDQNGANTPWLAGLYWPYRQTTQQVPFRVPGSGGFEGMALSADGKKLLPLLEKPLVGAEGSYLLIHEFDLQDKAYTGKRYRYELEPKGSAIGDFVMFSAERGLIIERDGSQGDMDGHKKIYEIELNGDDEAVEKWLAVDLLKIKDPYGISRNGMSGDVGIGEDFGFPFVTIESVVVLSRNKIAVMNDNNYPFSIGRHVGAGLPDDNEFITIQLDQPLGIAGKRAQLEEKLKQLIEFYQNYPNPFTSFTIIPVINPLEQEVEISIYSEDGEKIKTIHSGSLAGGAHSFEWDGTDSNGRQVSTGMYACKLKTKEKMKTLKLIKL